MLTRKGSRRHRRLGRLYLFALAGLGLTAPILVAVDWAHRWHLAVLGALALGAATAGFVAVRLRHPVRLTVHITGMGIAYVAMLTAFYVDYADLRIMPTSARSRWWGPVFAVARSA